MTTNTSTPTKGEAPEEKKGQQPVYRQQYGSVTVAVWERITDDQSRMWHDYTLQRFYRDPNEPSGYGHSNTFRPSDTADLQLASWSAHRWIRTEGRKRALEFNQQHGSPDSDDAPF